MIIHQINMATMEINEICFGKSRKPCALLLDMTSKKNWIVWPRSDPVVQGEGRTHGHTIYSWWNGEGTYTVSLSPGSGAEVDPDRIHLEPGWNMRISDDCRKWLITALHHNRLCRGVIYKKIAPWRRKQMIVWLYVPNLAECIHSKIVDIHSFKTPCLVSHSYT